jgi:hypothetical protein
VIRQPRKQACRKVAEVVWSPFVDRWLAMASFSATLMTFSAQSVRKG